VTDRSEREHAVERLLRHGATGSIPPIDPSGCLDAEQLAAWSEGALPPDAALQVDDAGIAQAGPGTRVGDAGEALAFHAHAAGRADAIVFRLDDADVVDRQHDLIRQSACRCRHQG